MSTESKAFWLDYQKRNGTIDVPGLLDLYAAAKDAEIAALKTDMQHSRQIEAVQAAQIKRLREGINEMYSKPEKYFFLVKSLASDNPDLIDGIMVPRNDEFRQIFPAEPEKPPLVCHEMTPEENAEAAGIIKEAWEGIPTIDESKPSCTQCGEDVNLSYMEQYANGEEWKCNECGHVFIEPTQRT